MLINGQRRDKRVPVLVRVDYRTSEGTYNDYAEDLSAGGIFISTPSPLPAGTLLTVEFHIPESQKPLRVRAVVAWSRAVPKGPGHRRGMGVKFEGLTVEERKRINELVRRHR